MAALEDLFRLWFAVGVFLLLRARGGKAEDIQMGTDLFGIIINIIHWAILISSLGFILFAYLTLFHCKPDVKVWRDTFKNPFAVLIMPELLSEEGLRYRKASLYLLLSTGVLITIAVIYDTLAGQR